jgi:hypothetical protein
MDLGLTYENVDPKEEVGEEVPTTKKYIYKYLFKFMIYLAIFALFTINLIAVTVSLSCNNEEGLPFKLLSALYAFFFGIMYILFNYFIYRVQIKGEITKCAFCKYYPFSFKSRRTNS